MDQEEHLARLEANQRAPLHKWLHKYQHIERLGHMDVQGLLDGDCIIQTKIDGANATVAWDAHDKVVIASRNQAISIGGTPPTGFRGLVEYVLGRKGIYEFLRGYPHLILRGEWLVPHSLMYKAESYNQLYVFDVEDSINNFYLPAQEYAPLLHDYNILTIPYVSCSTPTQEYLVALLNEPDEYGAAHKEGLVVKRYDFTNRFGRTTWGKLVHEDFSLKNKAAFGPVKNDEMEVHFATIVVTSYFVNKLIDKLQDRDGEVSVRNMKEIMGRAWHEALTEELPDFVQKRKVGTFDFNRARKHIENLVRNLALERFNTPT